MLPEDEDSVEFKRIDGNGAAPVIVFLPWRVPFRFGSLFSAVPKDFVACYEMPCGIVSSEPEVCFAAFQRVVADALRIIDGSASKPEEFEMIGLSIGTAPATYLANMIGARLTSVASADRGDLLFWESPASRTLKLKAVRKGYLLDDFSEVMRGYNPIENLRGLRAGSHFIFGTRDELVPPPRRDELISAVRTHTRQAQIVMLDADHLGTILHGAPEKKAALTICE